MPDCPRRTATDAGAQFVTILMVYDLESRYANISLSFLTEEYHDCLTIDFGATANPAGRAWANGMLERMSAAHREKVRTVKNPRAF
eukprot:723642-Heterocapsa_arctica.AAC.1